MFVGFVLVALSFVWLLIFEVMVVAIVVIVMLIVVVVFMLIVMMLAVLVISLMSMFVIVLVASVAMATTLGFGCVFVISGCTVSLCLVLQFAISVCHCRFKEIATLML